MSQWGATLALAGFIDNQQRQVTETNKRELITWPHRVTHLTQALDCDVCKASIRLALSDYLRNSQRRAKIAEAVARDARYALLQQELA